MKWLIGITIYALSCDWITKWLTVERLRDYSIKIGSLVEFRQTHNTGMALGIFADSPWAGLLLPLAAIVCGWLLMRRYKRSAATSICCGLILGGFIGNYAERLIRGHVTDMIYFPWMPWFVCNIADICICFGVAGLAFSLLFRPQDWEDKERNAEDAPN